MLRYRLRVVFFYALLGFAVIGMFARRVIPNEFVAATVSLFSLLAAIVCWIFFLMNGRCPVCKTPLPLKGGLTMENCPYCKRLLKKPEKKKRVKKHSCL